VETWRRRRVRYRRPATKGARVLGATADITTLLTDPAVASALGLAFGIAAALAAWAGVRRLTPDDPVFGMAQAAVINFAAMLAAFGALAFFFFFAREALVYFGGGLVTGFLVTAIVQFLRAAGAQKAH